MAKVKFGDVVKEVKNKIDRNNNPYEFYVAGDHMDTDSLSIPRKGSFLTDDVGPAFIREFKKGQVLYGSRRTYLRKVAVADFDGVTANTTFVLETKDENVLRQRLLPFIMYTEGFTAWSIKKSRGSTNPYVLFNDLADYEFDLPSIEEQDRLVEVLWSINDTLQAYQNLLAETDALVQAQFVEMFGGITKNQRNWPVRTLGEIYNVTSSKRIYARELSTTGIPFLKVADVLEKIETGNSHPKTFITEQKFLELQKNNLVPNPGDILITSRGTIGKCYVVQAHDKFYFQDGMISWLRVKVENVLLSEFLSALFKTDDISNTIEKSALKTTVMYLSLDKLANLKVICPPINKQNEYLSFMQQNEKAKSTLQNTIASLQATKRCILEDAFEPGRKE